MKTHFYLKSVLFFSALLLFTCQQDDAVFQSQTEELSKALYQQRSVSLKELPKVKSLIDSYSNLSLSRSETTENAPIFEMEHILELIDTLNNTNYAFNFRYADTPIGEFYNLIIGKTPDGQLRTPYVLKYKCDEYQLETYIANNFEFSSFKGAVSLHRYTDFFELGTFGVRGDPNCPKLDAVGDPIPCETQPIDGGGSSGIGDGGIDGPDSGTGNTGTTDYGGSFTCTYLGIFVTGCNGTNTESLHAIGSCRGPDLDSATQTGVWDCSSGFEQEAPPNTAGMITDTDCPECDSGNGGVPVNPISIETMRSTLKYNLNLTKAGLSYIGKSENNEVVAIVYNYFVPYIELNVTSFAYAKDFAERTIDILSTPIITSKIQLDYEAAILKMIKHLRLFGGIEDEIYADYIESLIPVFNVMTVEEVGAIYSQVKTTVNELTINYAKSILTVVVTDLIIPIIVYAIFEATAGTAIKLLQKIPISMVLRGARLNKLVKKIGLLGVQGTSNNIRIITTSSPISKAKELFNTLTKNAVSSTIYPNGTIVANMGNGNLIKFRTVSGSGFSATIELYFTEIWAQARILKFH